jgi:uncharacterized protein (DUF2235 family)
MMRRAMAKNIILCSDGTGNADIKGRGTNVFKLFEAVDLNEHRTNPLLTTQLAFYDDGVGTQGSVLVKMMGNATGFGLSANVRQLYRELSRVYDHGDRIYLFGFSRGAFTVRTLADMIGKLGVLRGESFTTYTALREAVDAAYRAYRASYDSALTRQLVRLTGGADGDTRVREFKKAYKHHDEVPIEFIGVWDTVDAVGMPFAIADFVNTLIYQFKFPDRLLGAHVRHACHALSLDDDRRAFDPVLWELTPQDAERIEQVWFAGVHSNVGGGYPKQGMSLVALDWMLAHAETHGLRLQPLDNEMFRGHASVDDMMYNPRAGLGLFYRWAPRDVRAHCGKSGIAPSIHLTAIERIAHGTDDYAPGNIPPGATVSVTPPTDVFADWHERRRDPDVAARARKLSLLRDRADAVQLVLERAHAGGGYLLDHARRDIRLGEVSYWAFVAAWFCFAVLALAVAGDIVEHRHVAWHWWIPVLVTGALGAFAVAAALSREVDSRMSDRFSTFWHPYQPKLREALKQAHAAAKAAEQTAGGLK